MSKSDDYEELGRRARRLLELADWDDYVTDNVRADSLRIRLMGSNIVIESVRHAQTVYGEDVATGSSTAWNADLIPDALETLRRHMVLEDLADV